MFSQIIKIEIEKEINLKSFITIKSHMINMNLPAINNNMKNHNNHSRQDPTSLADGFGLGIQVFKIQSVKNMDNNFKAKNRTAIKNIENPTQSHNYKPPVVPKPKKLPSLEKSNSQINPKQRLSAFLSSKMETNTHQSFTDKIFERKQPNVDSHTIVTPVSYSMRKKANMSTQKNISSSNQPSKPAVQKNFIIQKEKPGRALGQKLNQTAPPQTMYKPEELYYQNYHVQHQVLLRFYSEYEGIQRQHLKQIKQLKKLKENQMDHQTYERVQYLQSIEGKINSVIQTMEKQQFENKAKDIVNEKKPRKMLNTIVPITGFEWSQMDCFQYDPIQSYQNKDYQGSFKVNNFQNIDLAPLQYPPKEDQDDQ